MPKNISKMDLLSLPSLIKEYGGWIMFLFGGGGGLLGVFSPIVGVLGIPLASVIGAIIVLLLYGVIRSLLFDHKRKVSKEFPETFWELTFANGVNHTIGHPNIRSYWGFKEFYTLTDGSQKTYCVISFKHPITKPKIDIKAKQGEMVLQKRLGIGDGVFIEDDSGMIWGMALTIIGELDMIDSRYKITFEQL